MWKSLVLSKVWLRTKTFFLIFHCFSLDFSPDFSLHFSLYYYILWTHLAPFIHISFICHESFMHLSRSFILHLHFIHILWIFHAYFTLMYISFIFHSNVMKILWISLAHFSRIWRTFHAPYIHISCAFHAYFMNISYTFHAPSCCCLDPSWLAPNKSYHRSFFIF